MTYRNICYSLTKNYICMSKKLLLTTLVVFVANMLGGWLIYGTLLKTAAANNTPEAVKPLMMDPPNMGMLSLGQLVLSFLMAWILERTNSNTIAKGITTALFVMVALSLGYNLMWCSMMNMYISMGTGLGLDLCASIGMAVLQGAAGGWMLSRGNKAAA